MKKYNNASIIVVDLSKSVLEDKVTVMPIEDNFDSNVTTEVTLNDNIRRTKEIEIMSHKTHKDIMFYTYYSHVHQSGEEIVGLYLGSNVWGLIVDNEDVDKFSNNFISYVEELERREV